VPEDYLSARTGANAFFFFQRTLIVNLLAIGSAVYWEMKPVVPF
jgi:hypothetical protein